MIDIRAKIQLRMLTEDNGGIECIQKIVKEEMEKDALWRFNGDKERYNKDYKELFEYAIKWALYKGG